MPIVNKMVKAINKTTEIFYLHDGTTDEVMTKGVIPVADAIGLDRVCFFRYDGSEGDDRLRFVYIWDRNTGASSDVPDEVNVFPADHITRRWIDTLSKGHCMNVRTRDMEEEEKHFFERFGINAIFFVPIFSDGELWGAVTMQDHTSDDYFADGSTEAELLQSAAHIFANAIIRDEMMNVLVHKQNMIDAMNNASMVFFSQGGKSFSDIMSDGIRIIADAAGVDRCSVWRNFVKDGELHLSQIYRWYGEDGGSTEPRPQLIGVNYANFVPSWGGIFLSGGVINGPARLMPEREAATLKKYGIISAFATPVIIDGNLWGFVLFEDHNEERYFDAETANMMCSSAVLCASVVIRNEMMGDLKTALYESEKSEGILKQREEMLRALNEMSAMLLSQRKETFNEIMSDGLSPISDAADLDRIVIYSILDQKTKILGQVCRWDKDAGGLVPINETMRVVPDFSVIKKWLEALEEDTVINLNIETAMKDEVEILNMFGVKSILLTPVFIHGQLWGTVSFQDHTNIRNFNEDSMDILRSAAFLCVSAIIRDEMEHEMAEANERTNVLLDTTPLSCQLWNKDYEKIDCNEEAVRLFGFKNKQEYLERYAELYPEFQPDGQKSDDKIKIYVKMAFETGSSSFNWIYRMLDGSMMPAEVRFVKVRTKDGELIAGYTRDLREHAKMMNEINKTQKTLELRLRQQELIRDISIKSILPGDTGMLINESLAKLGLYYNASQICVFFADHEKLNTPLEYSWTKSGEPIKLSHGDANLYSVIDSLFPKTILADTVIPVAECADVNKADMFHDLLSVDILAFISAPLYVNGKIWGSISIEQYAEPREWTEYDREMLIMASNTLSGIIVRDIHDKQLGIALKQATSASSAKSNFLANMSHEMRTPMNAIIGMTAIGKKANDIGQKDYALNKIGDASSHLLGVINDVLDISKIEANKLEINPIEFNFERMLQKVLTVINFRVGEKEQELSVDVDKNIPRFLIGDDQRLSQVITNLLSNAIKFTPERGKIKISASLVSEEDSECELKISVADSGIGISKENSEKLFHAFEQAETGISRKYGGSGLGLVISKRIIELMNGRIWVESEIGKGANFNFVVKLRRSDKSPYSLLAPGVNWKNVRILAVDDAPEILSQFKEIFGQLEMNCDVASNGFDACNIIDERGAYDIYFIDWRMPGMDGIELTRKIKKAAGDKPTVVIMITAMDWEQIREEAILAGVIKCLYKPLLSSTVIDCINECLGISEEKEHVIVAGEFGGKRMLVAEDVEINREIIITILEETGIVIECAENGIESLNMIKNHEKYDIILMDVQMPQMDGLEATRRIRLIPGYAETPIIAMTANVFKNDIEECIIAGMTEHLGKPLDVDKVMDILRTHLNG